MQSKKNPRHGRGPGLLTVGPVIGVAVVTLALFLWPVAGAGSAATAANPPAAKPDLAKATDFLNQLRQDGWYGEPRFLHVGRWDGDMPMPMLGACVIRSLMYGDPVKFRGVVRDPDGLKRLYAEGGPRRQDLASKTFHLDVPVDRVAAWAGGKLATELRVPFEASVAPGLTEIDVYQTDMVPSAVLGRDGGLRIVAADEWPALAVANATLYVKRKPFATLRAEVAVDPKADPKKLQADGQLVCRVYYDGLTYAGSWAGVTRKATYYHAAAVRETKGTLALDAQLAAGNGGQTGGAPRVMRGQRDDDEEYVAARIVAAEIRTRGGVVLGSCLPK